MADHTNQQGPENHQRFLMFQILWIVASAVLMISTWRLWVGTNQFPQIPLLSIFIGTSIWIDYVALAVCGIASLLMIGVLVRVSSRRSITLQLRIGCLVWAAGLMILFFTNQHRLQPWAWQFFIFAMLVGVSATKQSALSASRIVVVSIYLWSAIGKFDFQFLNGLGRQFASAMTDLIDLPISADDVSPWMVSLMPLGELLVGVLLIYSATRKLGVVAAIALHLGLITILGPWGMDHHIGVVVWNFVFAMITAVLFWPMRKPADSPAKQFSAARVAYTHTLTVVFTSIVVCLPLYSAWDHWLAWGLYSPNNRRCSLKLMVPPEQDIDSAIQPYLIPAETEFVGGLDVLKFDMGRMSLELLEAPIYPEARMQLGVVRWAQQRFNLPPSVVVSIEGKPDRFTGLRETKTIEQTQSADQSVPFLFNHLPR